MQNLLFPPPGGPTNSLRLIVSQHLLRVSTFYVKPFKRDLFRFQN